MSSEMLALAEALERDAKHDGHSSDWFVEHCSRVLRAAKALRSSSAGSRDREEIARIINPDAFELWQAQFDYSSKSEGVEFARRCADYYHQKDCDEARLKADAILSLHPGSDVQPSCEQSDSTTHRESVTRSSIATCCVTGLIAGDADACGDCDPCILGAPSVPAPVKRLLKENEELRNQLGELLAAQDAPPSTDASACPDSGFLQSSLNQSERYGCSLPPGACHCPQDIRAGCAHGRMIIEPTPPNAGDGEPVAGHDYSGPFTDKEFIERAKDHEKAARNGLAAGPNVSYVRTFQACAHALRLAAPLLAHPQPAPEVREASSSIEYQQKRGPAWDIIDEALLAYNDYMLDDDYDAQRTLDKIMQRMDTRRSFYHDGKTVLSGKGARP